MAKMLALLLGMLLAAIDRRYRARARSAATQAPVAAGLKPNAAA